MLGVYPKALHFQSLRPKSSTPWSMPNMYILCPDEFLVLQCTVLYIYMCTVDVHVHVHEAYRVKHFKAPIQTWLCITCACSTQIAHLCDCASPSAFAYHVHCVKQADYEGRVIQRLNSVGTLIPVTSMGKRCESSLTCLRCLSSLWTPFGSMMTLL